MTKTLKSNSLAAFAALSTLALTLPVSAQQAPPVPTVETKPLAEPKPAAAAPKPQSKAAPAGAGEGGLKARVESLEEQLVDMQVVVGTLESLAKSGGGSGSNARGSATSGDSARVEALENQVRNLSTQVQQLSQQVRGLGGVPAASPPPPVVTSDNNFGSTTVSEGDAIGGMIAAAPPPPVPNATPAPVAGTATPSGPPSVTTAALPPAGDGSTPKQSYETAYGYLLQRDYGAAEAAFDDFLKRYPSDSLAGNAQYWLGESHFVRGQYKAAAGAFLKGYQSYGQSAKAPDSLLKLAMSLDKLGQRDAACSSYAELSAKFPNASQSVKARAQSERQRVGCP